MADINDVIAAHESQMQRAFHQGSRGIATVRLLDQIEADCKGGE